MEKVAPYADGNCKYPPGECRVGCPGPCDRAVERVGTSVRVSVSVNGSDRSAGLTVTLEGPAVPGSLHVPSSGSAPPPLQQLPPRPARLLLPAPTARRLYSRSSAAPSSSLPYRPLAIAPFSPPPPRCPLRLPRRLPGRAVWGAPEPAVATAAAAPGWRRPGASFLPPLGPHSSPPSCPAWAPETQCTPQRGIFIGAAMMSGPWRCETG